MAFATRGWNSSVVRGENAILSRVTSISSFLNWNATKIIFELHLAQRWRARICDDRADWYSNGIWGNLFSHCFTGLDPCNKNNEGCPVSLLIVTRSQFSKIMLRVCSLNVFVFGIVFFFIFVFLYLYFYVLWSCNLSPHHSDEKSLEPLLECVLEKICFFTMSRSRIELFWTRTAQKIQMIKWYRFDYFCTFPIFHLFPISTLSVSCCRQSEASIFEILSF